MRRLSVRARSGCSLAICGLALLVALGGVAPANPSTQKVTGARKKTHKAQTVVPVAPEPVFEMTPAPPPPLPLTPGQMPPNAPIVTYDDGLLTIGAENSTLSDILSAVSATTGTRMDVPAGAGADRVWVTLGPGSARSILAALLSGTTLDYVIQAADEDPNLIQSVLLSVRSAGGKAGDNAGASGQSFSARYKQYQNRPNFAPADSSDTGSSASSDISTGPSDGDAPANPQPNTTADAQPSAADSAQTGTPSPSLTARLPLAVSEAEAHPAPSSTTQQAIPQMQNLFELRRQLQEQQNMQQKAGTH